MTKRVVPFILTAVIAVAACTSGAKSNSPVRHRTPRAASHVDLSLVPTSTDVVEPALFPAAATAAVAALRAPETARLAAPVQLLAPQQFSATSAIDVLRLRVAGSMSVGAVEPPAGWRWLLLQDALTTAGGYTQWRIVIAGFESPGAAMSYLASPGLLPAALRAAAPSAAPAGLGARAKLLASNGQITPLNNPGASMPGGLAACVWQRGQIVFTVTRLSVPATPDSGALLEAVRALDAQSGNIPGG